MYIKVFGKADYAELQLPMKDAELSLRMKQIGINEVIPICRLVSVMGRDDKLLEKFKGTDVNLDELNYFAKAVNTLSGYKREVLEVHAREQGAESLKDLINLTFNMKGVSLITNFSDTADVGKQLYMDENTEEAESGLSPKEFIGLARKIFSESKLKAGLDGVYVDRGFEKYEVYRGRTFPKNAYDTQRAVVVLEMENQSGEADYLYLPTEICACDKLKARLSVQDFSECRVTDIQNRSLPEELLPPPASITNAGELTFFNEMCKEVKNFSQEQMQKLSMAVEFVGAKKFTEITCIAKRLTEFKTDTSIHNDVEYGKSYLRKAGNYSGSEVLLSRLTHDGKLGEKQRNSDFLNSGYVKEGFVGTNKKTDTYMQYKGEYADLLEIHEENCQILCLYSPLTAELYKSDTDVGLLNGYDLLKYEKEIMRAVTDTQFMHNCEESRGLMHSFKGSVNIAGKVVSARPMVQEIDGELKGVLKCFVRAPLTKKELKVLKEFWQEQASAGLEKSFMRLGTEVGEGRLYVGFWSEDPNWEVLTEEELSGGETQINTMNM